ACPGRTDAAYVPLRLTCPGGGKPPGPHRDACHADRTAGYAGEMTDVADPGNRRRRIQRALARAAPEQRALRDGHATGRGGSGPDGDAEVRRLAYEVVLGVLDEILTRGRRAGRE